MAEPLVSQHGGKRNGCWAVVPRPEFPVWPYKMCPIDAREGMLTCTEHADREELARELVERVVGGGKCVPRHQCEGGDGLRKEAVAAAGVALRAAKLSLAFRGRLLGVPFPGEVRYGNGARSHNGSHRLAEPLLPVNCATARADG